MLDRNQRAWTSKLAEGRTPTPTDILRSAVDHRPKSGDLVITREVSHPDVRYTIGRLDTRPQLSCASRDQALTLARTFAGRYRVELWEKTSGRFTSIAPRGHGRS